MRGYWKAGVAYGEKCYTAEWEILQRPGPSIFLSPFPTPRFSERLRHRDTGIDRWDFFSEGGVGVIVFG